VTYYFFINILKKEFFLALIFFILLFYAGGEYQSWEGDRELLYVHLILELPELRFPFVRIFISQ
jgi:hypothetical protein